MGYLPKISVIITCYNYASYVCQSIDSVLSQSYQNKELIVVDDCSDDESRELIANYGEALTRVFHETNMGQAGAFNSGFSKSTGDIVIFLDADDFLECDALNSVSEAFLKLYSVSMYRMNLVDSRGKFLDLHPKPEQRFDSGDLKSMVLRRGRITGTVTSGLVFNRSFLNQVLPIPVTDFKQGADGYLMTLAPLFGIVGDGEAIVLSNYRKHGGNHSDFSRALEKRACWSIQHDNARYDSLRDFASRLELEIREPLGSRDYLYLEQNVALLLFSEASGIETRALYKSRLSILIPGLASVRNQNLTVANSIIMGLWWLSIILFPKTWSREFYSWNKKPESRPGFLRAVSKFLRRI